MQRRLHGATGVCRGRAASVAMVTAETACQRDVRARSPAPAPAVVTRILITMFRDTIDPISALTTNLPSFLLTLTHPVPSASDRHCKIADRSEGRFANSVKMNRL